MPGRLPLPTLLSQVLVAFTREFEQDGAGLPPVPALTMWSNVLQYIGDEGIDQRGLPPEARLTKRVIGPALRELEKAGYVTIEGQTKTVRLTNLGRQARDAVPEMLEALDKRWRKRFGDNEIETLRTSLQDLVGRLDHEFSHYPVSYGSADTSITGHGGQDWTFCRRVDNAAVSTLPLSALLAQALVAFSVDYESVADWSLAATVNVLRFLTDEPQPLKDVPPVGALRWHGLVVVDKAGKTKTVRLAPRGRRALDAYLPLTRDVEERWTARYGEETMRTLRASLERIVAQLDDDLPHHPSMLLHL